MFDDANSYMPIAAVWFKHKDYMSWMTTANATRSKARTYADRVDSANVSRVYLRTASWLQSGQAVVWYSMGIF